MHKLIKRICVKMFVFKFDSSEGPVLQFLDIFSALFQALSPNLGTIDHMGRKYRVVDRFQFLFRYIVPDFAKHSIGSFEFV